VLQVRVHEAKAVTTTEPNTATAATPERKVCPVCGASFGCMAAQGTCWCADVKLSAEEAANLRSRFSDCLCPRCLALAVDRGTDQQRGSNPAGNPAPR
jgi:hypothetical protein